VTEAEWLACAEPRALLEFVRGRLGSGRKLRLFLCACARRLWPLLKDVRGRQAVEVAERYADGLVKLKRLHRACRNAEAAVRALAAYGPGEAPAYCAVRVAHYAAARHWDFNGIVLGCLYYAARAYAGHLPGNPVPAAELAALAALVRELFGNPFSPTAADPAWLGWDGDTVPRLARAIYAESAFDRLPVLADALEEAGCADAEILGHLRGSGPHVRGCWAVDLLLAKGRLGRRTACGENELRGETPG
jgi:hypothetical protein